MLFHIQYCAKVFSPPSTPPTHTPASNFFLNNFRLSSFFLMLSWGIVLQASCKPWWKQTWRNAISHGSLFPMPGSKAVWDHLDSEWSKRQPTSKVELWNVFQEAWRAISEEVRLCWRMMLVRPNIECFGVIFHTFFMVLYIGLMFDPEFISHWWGNTHDLISHHCWKKKFEIFHLSLVCWSQRVKGGKRCTWACGNGCFKAKQL